MTETDTAQDSLVSSRCQAVTGVSDRIQPVFLPSCLAGALKTCYKECNVSTLRDVARHAGVSVATASRVARGSVAVKHDTSDRVERSMRELLYVPPGRIPATGVIGLLLPNFENPIFPTIAQALQARTAASGYASILCTTESAAFREVEYVHMLLDRKVEGMIFVSCEMTNLSGEHDHYARLLDDGARIVFVNGALNRLDIPSVGVDERSSAELAARHLLDLGHTRIALRVRPRALPPGTREGSRLARRHGHARVPRRRADRA